jgi:predicted DNA-binding transcriptional regulator YafY
MITPSTRLITLIMLLQQKPNQKAADLAQKLDVSVRTLHRYINMLDEMGIPIYSERGPNGGFSLVRGYKLPPLILSLEEAVTVFLGTDLVIEMWGALYHDAAQGALAKLGNILPDEQLQEIDWARRALRATHLHRGKVSLLMPVIEQLRHATREFCQVTIHYQGRERSTATQRIVDPYALVHRWGWWYLVGYCHLRAEVRSFRVDRIHELHVLDERFDLPPDFNLQTYLDNEPHTTSRIQVRIHFDLQGVVLLRDDPTYWDEIEEQPDGTVIATVRVPGMAYATRLVLSFGCHAEVLEPTELRRLVAEQLRTATARYDNTP